MSREALPLECAAVVMVYSSASRALMWMPKRSANRSAIGSKWSMLALLLYHMARTVLPA